MSSWNLLHKTAFGKTAVVEQKHPRVCACALMECVCTLLCVACQWHRLDFFLLPGYAVLRQTARPQQHQLTALICFDRGSFITALDAHLQHGAWSWGAPNDGGASCCGGEAWLLTKNLKITWHIKFTNYSQRKGNLSLLMYVSMSNLCKLALIYFSYSNMIIYIWEMSSPPFPTIISVTPVALWHSVAFVSSQNSDSFFSLFSWLEVTHLAESGIYSSVCAKHFREECFTIYTPSSANRLHCSALSLCVTSLHITAPLKFQLEPEIMNLNA